MLTKFYHSTIKKAIIVFGSIFNNINIDRRTADNQVKQTIRVPLSYAQKQKFIARNLVAPNAEADKAMQIILPRMAFEMIDLTYDPSRRVSPIQQNRTIITQREKALTQYAPTPYNMTVGLYIYAKNQDDGLQIIEQILPYFNPDFNVTINAIPELGIKHDLAILLDSVSYEDDYDGDFKERRSIIWTLMFTIKLNLYGPINNQSVVRKTISTLFQNIEMTDPSASTVSVTLNPKTAAYTDNWDFITEFDENIE